MRLDRIAVGDIVKASIKGRTVYGEVREVGDGVVRFDPLFPCRRLAPRQRPRNHRPLAKDQARHQQQRPGA